MSHLLNGLLGNEPVAGADSAELLVNLHGSVDFDGGAATFDVEFSNQHPFQAHIPFAQMPPVFEEIRRTAQLMMARQRYHIDHGAGAMLDLLAEAPRPASIEILVDPLTFDRLFFIQFHDRPPLTLRISALELPGLLQELARAAAQAAN